MIQSIFLLSSTGEVLIERHFRGVTPRSVCEIFWERASVSLNHHGGLSTTNSAIAVDPFPLYDTVPPIMELTVDSYEGTTTTTTTTGMGAEDGNRGESMASSSNHSGSNGNTTSTSYHSPSHHQRVYLFHILRDGLSYLAACTEEISPLLVLEFLHRVADIFVDYFGSPADESAIKDNFSTVYQLLEEMLDYGWPLTTEPNALKAMIRPPTVMGKLQSVMTGGSNAMISDALPSGTISNIPWRTAGVKHLNNEIYIDIIEEVDAVLDMHGNTISSDVSGSIQAQSNLSGVPDLLLTFKDPSVIDDCSFHPCVRYTVYENDNAVSFVPPDGRFQLMKYRVKPSILQQSSAFNPPILCTPQLTYEHTTTTITNNNNNNNNKSKSSNNTQSYLSSSSNTDHPSSNHNTNNNNNNNTTTTITSRGNLLLTVTAKSINSLIYSPSKKGSIVTMEDVSLTIPFPKNTTKTSDLQVNVGQILYDEAGKVAKWVIGNMDERKRPTPQLRGWFEVQLTTNSGRMTGGGGDMGGVSAGGIISDPSIITRPEEHMHLVLTWKVPLASCSGLAVNGLSLSNVNYKPYKGVRNIAKSGRYQIRCS